VGGEQELQAGEWNEGEMGKKWGYLNRVLCTYSYVAAHVAVPRQSLWVGFDMGVLCLGNVIEDKIIYPYCTA
jgi:hypothetical protein